MVVSGQHAGILDPHGKCITAVAGQALGKRVKLTSLLEYPGHASSFCGIFDLTPTTENYPATLFRFPLREAPSDISSNLYIPDKIKENLFESFREEASFILTFLKSVNRISLYENRMDQENVEPRFLFGVEVKEEQRALLNSERKYFQAIAEEYSEQNRKASVQVLATTFVEKGPNSDDSKEHHWLILNAIGSNSTELQKLDTKLKVLPWVGLAVHLPTELNLQGCHSRSVALDDTASLNQIISKLCPVLRQAQLSVPWCERSDPCTDGQAFCFLPLPGKTLLPVHVHGYLAVADNRRSIEWPQHDVKGERAEWNKLLVHKLVAPAYALLLACRALILRYRNTPALSEANPQSLPDPFEAWPVLSMVKSQPIWSELVQPTLSLASNLNFPFLWTAASGGKWVTPSDAYYLPDCLAPDSPLAGRMPLTAADLLVEAGEPIVFLPPHVAQTLFSNDAFQCRATDHMVTPKLVRRVIRDNENVQSKLLHASNATCDSLLAYVLSDMNKSLYHELVGIPLLSLTRESTPIQFELPTGTNTRYVLEPRLRHTLHFLPGIESLIVDLETVPTASVRRTLHEIAVSKCLQLKLATPEVIATILLQTSIQSWCKQQQPGMSSAWVWTPGKSNHPHLDWITEVWRWLNSNSFPLRALCEFNLPLIVQQGTATQLSSYTLLEVPSPELSCLCVLPEHPSGPYSSSEVQALLEQTGLIVVSHSQAIFRHAQIHKIVPVADPEFVLKMIVSKASMVSGLAEQHKHVLRQILASYYSINPVPSECVATLRSMVIFEAGVGATSRRYVSLKKAVLPFLSPVLPCDIEYPPKWLVCSDPATVSFIERLGMKEPPFEDFCMSHLIPFALRQSNSRIILWILKQWDVSRRSKLFRYLSTAKVVGTRHNPKSFKQPNELFNPSEEVFKCLFDSSRDDVFPAEEYSDSIILVKLKALGLRSWDAVKSDKSFLAERARSVGQLLEYDREAAWKRSSLILSVVADSGNNVTAKRIAKIPFLFPEEQRPSHYPASMEWQGEPHESTTVTLRSMNETCLPIPSENQGFLVGSVRPVLSREYVQMIPIDKLRYLQMFCSPTVDDITCQLCRVVEVSDYGEDVNNIILEIYRYLSQHVEDVSVDSLPPKWIWWREQAKFLEPAQVVLRSPEILRTKLEPYSFVIEHNHDLVHFKDLFLKCQVKETIEPADTLEVLKAMKKNFGDHNLPEHELNIVCGVLEWLYNVKFESHRDVLLPTATGQLVKPQQCTYDDRQWLKQELSQHLTKFIFVHEKIPGYLAKYFQVRPLSARVAPSSKLALAYELAGPHETITHRIHQVIQEYATNIDVFKELLQNADDAGATEVKFMIDWRVHPHNLLFSDSLKPWQGPALIAYNNAVFSDQDFRHICQLAGETKLNDPMKTGRFGLGFCATYHLTDVPSFISRKYFTMFDPHTIYLGERVSPGEPGMRIDLVKHKGDLRVYADQFSPYDGLFGCNVFDLPRGGYQGTLFRFPLRSVETSRNSEISKEIYTSSKVQGLISDLKRSAAEVLLFLKNVEKLSVLVCEESSGSGWKTKKVFSVTKSQTSPQRLELIRMYSPHVNSYNHVCSTVELQCFEEDNSASDSTSRWLLCSSLGTGKSHQLSATPDGMKQHLVPLAEVAVNVATKGGYPMPNPTVGRIFCFLPLPMSSGLPFHVNGFFDVGKDRRSLSATDDETFGSQWNAALAEDALPQAILHLLASLTTESKLQSHPERQEFLKAYYSLCYFKPASGTMLCTSMVPAFPRELQTTQMKVLWSEVHSGQWVAPSSAVLLQKAQLNDKVYQAAFTLMCQGNLNVVNLPSHVFKMLESFLREKGRVCNYQTFCKKILLPKIQRLDEEIRDIHLLHLLENINSNVSSYKWAIPLLKGTACIPCQGSTPTKFVFPSRLIDCRNPLFTALYEVSEERFPEVAFQESAQAMSGLITLGMASYSLQLSDLKERTQTVSKLARRDPEAARKRCFHILLYIDCVYHTSTYSTSNFKKLQESIGNISFLPALPKPEGVQLPWWNRGSFVSPQEAYLPDKQFLVFSQAPVVQIDKANQDLLSKYMNALRIIGVDKVSVHKNVVLEHLVSLITHMSGTRFTETTMRYFESERVFVHLYERLQQLACIPNKDSKVLEDVKRSLKNRPFIWQDGHLLYPNQVLMSWPKNCYPHLCGLSSANLKFKDLFSELGVHESASVVLLVNVLRDIRRNCQESPISDYVLEFVEEVVRELCSRVGKEAHLANLDIYLPDEDRVMRLASSLASDDIKVDWVKNLPDYNIFCQGSGGHFVNPSIPRERALKLGVKPILSAILQELEVIDFLEGTDFGQYEDLCDRLNSILKKYPADHSMFQEFVQNADDAQASEIVFVLDRRNDFCDKRLFSDESNWKSLQHSPALCIINNRKFTEKDIQGITKLGRGGKRESEEQIGRFGIGFNVSYHLTDCPSFVSYAEGGAPENFCIFDPTLAFAPRATKGRPGRRWKVSRDQVASFPDQFAPYLADDIPRLAQLAPNCMQQLEASGYVVFRLPLVLAGLKARTAHSLQGVLRDGKQYTVDEVFDLLCHLEKASRTMLLFLNHVRQVSMFEITKDGEYVHHFSTRAAIPPEYHTQCEEFTRWSRMARETIQSGGVPEPVTSFHHVTVTHNVEERPHNYRRNQQREYCSKNATDWIIQRTFGSRTLDHTLLQCAASHNLQPIAGIAAQFSIENTPSSEDEPLYKDKPCGKVFCYLPMPLKSQLPVHVNAHFVVDDSRKHLENEGIAICKWNQALARNIIVPTYVDLLLKGREFVQMSTERRDWYHDLFPSCTSEGEIGDLKIVEGVYEELWRRNSAILLYEPYSMPGHPPVEWQWLQLSGDSQAYFDEPFHVKHTMKLTWVGTELRSVLLQLGMHITSAPSHIYNRFKDVEASQQMAKSIVNPEKVVSFLQHLNIWEGSNHTIVKDNVLHFLRFILDGYKQSHLPGVLAQVPLMVTCDGSLCCTKTLFKSEFADLLPAHSRKFVDPELEKSDVGKVLSNEESGVIVPLPIEFVAENIVLPNTRCPISPSPAEKGRIKDLWRYLQSHITFLHVHSAAILQCFSGKPIIPTTMEKLYPISMAKAVLNDFGDNAAVSNVMKKLGYSFLDSEVMGIDLTSITTSCSNASDIVQCLELEDPLHCDAEFSPEEISAFISLLSSRSDILRRISGTLQKLNIFQYFDNSFGSVKDRYKNVYILPQGITVKGIDEVLECHPEFVVLNNPDFSTSRFYQNVLNLPDSNTPIVKFYAEFIIPNLRLMSDENIQHHIRDLHSLELRIGSRFDQLKEQLKITPFIPIEGKHILVCDMYDPDVEVFNLFKCQKLLPQSWNDPQLVPFLRSLELKSKVSTEEWLSFAYNLVAESQGAPTPLTIRKSLALLEHLIQTLNDYYDPRSRAECDFDVDPDTLQAFLRSVAVIPFIYTEPPQLQELLRSIFPNLKLAPKESHTQQGQFVPFEGSVFYPDAELSALCKPVLPESCQKLPRNTEVWKVGLGIEQPLKVETTVCNLVTLCRLVTNNPTQMQTSSSVKEAQQEKLKEILVAHYKCIDNSLQGSNPAVAALTVQPCVLLQHQGLHLVQPSQLVRQLPGDCDFAPFCYKAPDCIRSCPRLLDALGVPEYLNISQCVSILAAIHTELENCGQDELSPVDEYSSIAIEVYNELVRCVRKSKDEHDFDEEELYLPDEKGTLFNANELLHNDVPWYATRLTEGMEDIKFLKTPPNDEQGERTLPEAFGVIPLSTIVTEVLHDDMNSADVLCPDEVLHTQRGRKGRCEIVQTINTTLQSQELYNGLCRIFYDNHGSAPTDLFKEGASKLRDVEVRCIQVPLKTILWRDGTPIPNTEDTGAMCHVTVENVLYIAPHTRDFSPRKLVEDLANAVGQLLDKQLRNLLLVSAIFECEPHHINATLDGLRVAPFDPNDSEPTIKRHSIGEVVSINSLTPVDLLVSVDYQPREKVVYQSRTTLRYAEVVHVPKTSLQLREKSVIVRTCDSTSGEVTYFEVSVSPVLLFKILSPSQRQVLSSGTSTLATFAIPVLLANVPCSDFDALRHSLDEVFHNVVHSSSSSDELASSVVTLLTLRLVKHLHYWLVTMNDRSDLYQQAKPLLRHLATARHPHCCDIDRLAQPELHNLLSLVVREIKQIDQCSDWELLRYVDELTPFQIVLDYQLPTAHAVSVIVECDSVPSTRRLPYISPAHVSQRQPQPPQQYSRFAGAPSRFVTQRHVRGYGYPALSRFSPEEKVVMAPPTCLKSARMWLEQAKADYMAASTLVQCRCQLLKVSAGTEQYEATPGPQQENQHFPALVCFLCHEIVEKCTKGVLYAYCGLKPDLLNNSHLIALLEELKGSQHVPGAMKSQFEECIMRITEHEYQSRLPNYQIPPCAPAAVYTADNATEALTAVQLLLRGVATDETVGELLGDIAHLPQKEFISTLQSVGGGTTGFPDNWEILKTGEDFKLVLLDPYETDREEYEQIESKFLQTLPHAENLKIERVENRRLWSKYRDKSERMLHFDGILSEKLLFHGSRDTKPEEIYQGDIGFDMRFSRVGLWGTGNYFAVNASYSNGYAHVTRGFKKMLAAWVLTGYSKELPPESYRRPPERHTESGIVCLYDSISGFTGGSKVYITYDNDHAYPAYVITYN